MYDITYKGRIVNEGGSGHGQTPGDPVSKLCGALGPDADEGDDPVRGVPAIHDVEIDHAVGESGLQQIIGTRMRGGRSAQPSVAQDDVASVPDPALIARKPR